MKIIDVTPENAIKERFFCIKNTKDPGFKAKQNWFIKRYEEGLRIKILKNEIDKSVAFIEYIPGEYAWRPIDASGYMFIHCMYTYSNTDKGKGYASLLIKACEEDANKRGLSGVTCMTSDGTWITDKRLFEKNGYSEIDKLGRFELMAKKFNENDPLPKLIDWTKNLKAYTGWHILYSDQCPWHYKSVNAIKEAADEHKIKLNIHKITSSEEAKKMPSGFGVFNLIHNKNILSDHYISQTRFKNILKKEQ